MDVVVQVNLRLLCSVCYHTKWHYIVVFGSILFYFAFLALYSALRPGALNSLGKSDNAFFALFEASLSAPCSNRLSCKKLVCKIGCLRDFGPMQGVVSHSCGGCRAAGSQARLLAGDGPRRHGGAAAGSRMAGPQPGLLPLRRAPCPGLVELLSELMPAQ